MTDYRDDWSKLIGVDFNTTYQLARDFERRASRRAQERRRNRLRGLGQIVAFIALMALVMKLRGFL